MYTHFHSLSTTFKDDVQNLQLKPLTCIVGEEASYKSALAESMVLALGNRHHKWHQPSDLVKGARYRDRGVSIALESADGKVLWDLPVDQDGKAKRPTTTFTGRLSELTPDERYCIVPHIAVQDLQDSAKGEKTLRRAYIRRFGNCDTIPTPIDFLEDEAKVWEIAVKDLSGSDGSTPNEEVLASLTEYFTTKFNKVKEALKISQLALHKRKSNDVVEAAGAELLPRHTKKLKSLQEDEQWLAKKLNELKDKLGLLGLTFSVDYKSKIQELQTKITDCKAEHDKVALKIELYKKRLNDISIYIEETKKSIDILEQALRETTESVGSAKANIRVYAKRVENLNLNCPYCGSNQDVIVLQTTLETFKQRLVTRETNQAEKTVELHRLHLKLDECRYDANDTTQKAVVLNQRETNLLRQIEELKTNTMEAENALRAQTVTSDNNVETRITLENERKDTEEKLTQLQVERKQLEEQISYLKLVQKLKESYQKELREIRLLENEERLMKRFYDEAVKLQQDVMKTVATTASSEVSKTSLDDRKALFNASTCTWSVVRPNGAVYEAGAISGTEEASLKIGLACAWTRGSRLRVGIFDDSDTRGLSRKGMQDFFKALKDAYYRSDFNQVIVVWNRTEEVPTDWYKVVR